MKKFLIISLFYSYVALSYKIASQDLWVGGALGGTVNVARMDGEYKSPGGGMPIMIHVDYALDSFLSANAAFIPQFSPSAMTFLLQGGGRYWFSYFDAPYVPYADLGLSLSATFMGKANHYNIGPYFGGGINYFIMGDLLLGIGVRMTPSLAFARNQHALEFSTMGFIDLSFKL